MTWIIGRFLVPAIVLEAAIVAFVPLGWMKALATAPGPVAVIVGAFVGIPVPLPQIAAVPLLRGLRELGLGDGGAMALLVSGPVTSLPAIALLATVFQRPVLVLYAATGLVTALLAGFALLALG
jgi:hypothetical protein